MDELSFTYQRILFWLELRRQVPGLWFEKIIDWLGLATSVERAPITTHTSNQKG